MYLQVMFFLIIILIHGTVDLLPVGQIGWLVTHPLISTPLAPGSQEFQVSLQRNIQAGQNNLEIQIFLSA